MRIHSLEITGFGPFKHTQRIDFDALSMDGLFMLEGPTGAGKSSIIDAIVWVLYGVTAHEGASKSAASRAGTSQFAKRIRSDYCGPQDVTRVILEFSNGGARYRIQRTPTYMALKTRGEGETKINGTVRLEFLKPVHEALTRIEETYLKITEIMAMEVAQFSQLVVLPQGDFATFLHASSESRKEVLQRIFKTYFYENLEDYFEKRRSDIEKTIEARRIEISHFLRNIRETATSVHGEIDFDEVDALILDPNELRPRKVGRIKEVCLKLKRDSSEDKKLEKQIESQLKPIDRELAELDTSLKKISDKSKKQEELQGLVGKQSAIDAMSKQIAIKAKVSHLGIVLEELSTKEEERDDAYALIDEDLEDWTTDEVKKQIAKLRPEERRLQKLLTQNEDIETDISTAQEKLETALEIESAIKRLAVLEKSLAAVQKKVELKSQAILKSREDEKRGYAPYVARQLKLGQPCPVCGSKDHPKPIKPNTLFDPEKTTQLQEELDYLKEDLAESKSDLKAAKLLAGKKSLPSGELRSKLAQLKKKGAQSLKISEQFDQVSADLELLEGNLESITAYARTSKDVEALTKRLHADMTRAGLDDVDDLRKVLVIDIDKLQSQIAKHNTRIAEITSILNQKDYKVLPEEESLEKRKGELLESQSELQSKRSAITGRLALNEKVNENLDSLAASILDELASMDEILEKGKPYLDLASYAKGKNSLGLTLTNFVLQERLEMILERASLHLRRISNGKYEFRLQEERLGHQRKAGLGITVMDYFAGKERPAETLSGGETFYASLALALGLAEVVKADQGGVELGTLFIDEGFGSLSDNTLDEVLDVLEDLRSQDRIIGVISHVEGMKSQIPARLEVRPSVEGPSSVKMAVAGMD